MSPFSSALTELISFHYNIIYRIHIDLLHGFHHVNLIVYRFFHSDFSLNISMPGTNHHGIVISPVIGKPWYFLPRFRTAKKALCRNHVFIIHCGKLVNKFTRYIFRVIFKYCIDFLCFIFRKTVCVKGVIFQNTLGSRHLLKNFRCIERIGIGTVKRHFLFNI